MEVITVHTSPDAAYRAADRDRRVIEMAAIHKASCRWRQQNAVCALCADFEEMAARARLRLEADL